MMMKNEGHIERESTFACVMEAIEPSKRQHHIVTAKFVFAAVKEIRELTNGYAFHLPNESEILRKVGDFISLEQLCCPFFGFTLEVEREGGAVWLQLTGREGVKPFIQAEIGEFMGSAIAFSSLHGKGAG
jgi:hypothetical protein